MPAGKVLAGVANSVSTPAVLMRPISWPENSVNQRLPSGPRAAERLQWELSDVSRDSDHSYLANFLGEPEIAIWRGDNFLWRRIRRGDGILRHRAAGRDPADLVGIYRREPHVAVRPGGDVIHSRTMVQQIGGCRLCAI